MEQLPKTFAPQVQARDEPPTTVGYRIRPFKGWCLVRLLPHDYLTAGGLHLPDVAMLAASGMKEFPRKALVIAIGAWKQTKQGFHILPDFHAGSRVLVSEYAGTKLTRNIGEEYRLCRIDDVLATIEEELTAPAKQP